MQVALLALLYTLSFVQSTPTPSSSALFQRFTGGAAAPTVKIEDCTPQQQVARQEMSKLLVPKMKANAAMQQAASYLTTATPEAIAAATSSIEVAVNNYAQALLFQSNDANNQPIYVLREYYSGDLAKDIAALLQYKDTISKAKRFAAKVAWLKQKMPSRQKKDQTPEEAASSAVVSQSSVVSGQIASAEGQQDQRDKDKYALEYQQCQALLAQQQSASGQALLGQQSASGQALLSQSPGSMQQPLPASGGFGQTISQGWQNRPSWLGGPSAPSQISSPLPSSSAQASPTSWRDKLPSISMPWGSKPAAAQQQAQLGAPVAQQQAQSGAPPFQQHGSLTLLS